jgi:cyclopropane-fatty-acyl-phospholipid synthase
MNIDGVATGLDSREVRQPGALDRWLAARLQQVLARAGIRLRLWDGSSTGPQPAGMLGELIARDRGTLVGLVVYPDLWFGEAYTTGRLQVRGELQPMLEALCRISASPPSWWDRLRARIAAPNGVTRSRRNVHHHYDIGNDFYKLWLDDQLVYTCAYFERPDSGLEDAQRAKLDLVCRKLGLQPGERVLEAGCGWGALALHMARRYGVTVQAFNLSREQIAYARERAAREGLAERVEFVEADYRNASGRFDVFVSVGMLEHVGLRQFPSLADVIRRTVRGGRPRGLLHFIGRDVPRPLNAWVRRRIFPGAYPPTLSEVTERVLSPAGMSVLDVENLRLHYARTLAHWSRRFTAAADAVRGAYGEGFERAWQLYLSGSEAAFATGWLQLFQVTFAPMGERPPSWTRAEVYVPASDASGPASAGPCTDST